MNLLLRLVFAIVLGVLAYALLNWLATAVPQIIDILVGIIVGFIAFWQAPGVLTNL